MKLITSVLILAITGTALAQAPANKNAAAPGSKPAAAAVKPAATNPAQVPAKPATAAPSSQAKHPASATAAPKPSTAASKPVAATPKSVAAAKPVTAPAKSMAKPAVKKSTASASHHHNGVAKPEPKPAVAPADGKKPAEPSVSARNRRDPFLSIIMSRDGPACAGTGKKCIAIDQVTLQGVVRSPNGAIAVVSSGAKKTYFLRENDPVYNGVVVKISPDSIIFRETVMDRLGKTSQREVVKKIQNSPAA
jgi:hypothetical protein